MAGGTSTPWGSCMAWWHLDDSAQLNPRCKDPRSDSPTFKPFMLLCRYGRVPCSMHTPGLGRDIKTMDADAVDIYCVHFQRNARFVVFRRSKPGSCVSQNPPYICGETQRLCGANTQCCVSSTFYTFSRKTQYVLCSVEAKRGEHFLKCPFLTYFGTARQRQGRMNVCRLRIVRVTALCGSHLCLWSALVHWDMSRILQPFIQCEGSQLFDISWCLCGERTSRVVATLFLRLEYTSFR